MGFLVAQLANWIIEKIKDGDENKGITVYLHRKKFFYINFRSGMGNPSQEASDKMCQKYLEVPEFCHSAIKETREALGQNGGTLSSKLVFSFFTQIMESAEFDCWRAAHAG